MSATYALWSRVKAEQHRVDSGDIATYPMTSWHPVLDVKDNHVVGQLADLQQQARIKNVHAEKFGTSVEYTVSVAGVRPQ